MLGTILCIAFFGIYCLTLNKPDEIDEASHQILGYSLTLAAAWLYGILFVILRYLNLLGIQVVVPPFYLGIVT